MSGPFVVIDNAVFRKACAVDHAGLLRYAPAGQEPTRFDDVAAAEKAIAHTCAWLSWDPAAYQVLRLAEWEEEQLAPARRRRTSATAKAAEA